MTIDFARNNLDRETSPYLVQHADNPVHWQGWSQAALDEAERTGKPVLLSVGYAACHWCHVMAHESFENPAVADLMNAMFINIKVDREERPDIDTIYQTALAMLGEQGGWPLTMFLTPAGKPFWGGTYFPPETRYGRPGFPAVLERVKEVYETDRATIDKNVDALTNGLKQNARLPDAEKRPQLVPDVLDRAAERLLQEFDATHGGIGQAPKFPQVPILEMVWRAHLRSGNADMRHAVMNTLIHMAQGGIYDHLGGGFARYSVDVEWLAPHFEKMLYDNSALMLLMTQVWRRENHPLLQQRVHETAEWVLREMIAENGAFAATLDADSEGVEGKFYVWDEAEVDQVLGVDAALFKRHYDVTPEGNFEHQNILNRRLQPDLADAETEAMLATCRSRLLAHRSHRVRPGWDDKVLADWNGMMIAAMVEAGMTFAEDSWIDAARHAFDAVVRDMADDQGRLSHSFRVGDARHAGMLDDYAGMIRGALALHEVSGDATYLTHAETWASTLEQHFLEPDSGAYHFTADDAEALIVRSLSIADNATPNGNGVMIENLSRLWRLTGKPAWRQRLQALSDVVADQVTRNFFPIATALNAVAYDMAALDVVIVGPPDDLATDALLRAVALHAGPDRLQLRVDPDATLPDHHPAHGKTMAQGQATAYLCRQMVCGLPITQPDLLAQALAAAGSEAP